MCTVSIFVQDSSRYLSLRIRIVEARKEFLLKDPPQFPAETEDRGRTGFRNIVSFLAWDEGKVQNFSHDYETTRLIPQNEVNLLSACFS